jgi:catechol 2,3-dioxygenase-like lactoylglutathione lyase family enzyme
MLTRREAIGAIAAARIVTAAVPDKLPFTKLDHVETNGTDAQKSALFYARMFGGPIWKNNKTERRYVKLGPCYIAIEQGREPLGVDHFSAGIEGFQIADVHTYLQQRGIAYKDYPSGRDLNIKDPDGINIQLSADNTWKVMENTTASPEATPVPGPALFQPRGIDHILLNVTDPAKSAAFYEKIFGPVSQRDEKGTWFQVGTSRVGLLKGAKPGVVHFSVQARRLGEAAATEFRDPDGLLFQVTA